MTSLRKKIFNEKLSRLLHISIWGSIFLSAIMISNRFWSLEQSLWRSIGNIVPTILIFYFNLYLVNKYLEEKKYVTYFTLAIILVFLLGLFRANFNMLFPNAFEEVSNFPKQGTWWVIGVFTGIMAIFTGILYQMLYNSHRKEENSQTIIREQQEAQIQFLRGQINPHFLFNTLNNIYSLAVVGSDKTAPMVLKLSKLLRYVIYDGRVSQVSLLKEVNHIHAFIDLFQMKSEIPLDIQFLTHGIENDIHLEPMILIPIVENSFKHCDFDLNPKAFIRVELEVIQSKLYFRTLNTKSDQNQQKDRVGGVGLHNIRKRLNLRYGDFHLLEILDSEELFEVKLFINLEPFQELDLETKEQTLSLAT